MNQPLTDSVETSTDSTDSTAEAATSAIDSTHGNHQEIAPESLTEAPEGSNKSDQGSNAEAAKYRVKLRDKEAQLEAAQAQVQQYQRLRILDLAQDIQVPEDMLTLGGLQVDDFLDESGMVNESKVRQSVAAFLEERPGMRKPRFGKVELGAQGVQQADPTPTLASVIAGKMK
jgi:hypothetical protein